MSVQSEITRITNEVGTQSDLIDEIGLIVESEIARVTNEVSTQSNLIDEISTILDGKASASPSLQEKTVTPSAAQQDVIPDAEYDGLSKVTVNGDANLVPENIKEGANIFGVEGILKAGAEWRSLPSVRTSYTSDNAVQPRVGDPTVQYSFDLVFDALPAVILLKEEHLGDVTFCGASISQNNSVETFERKGAGWICIIDCVVAESDGKFNVKIKYTGHEYTGTYYMILPYE